MNDFARSQRTSTEYFVPFDKTGNRIKTIRFSGPWLWNQLPDDIKESKLLPIVNSQLISLTLKEY